MDGFVTSVSLVQAVITEAQQVSTLTLTEQVHTNMVDWLMLLAPALYMIYAKGVDDLRIIGHEVIESPARYKTNFF